MTPRASDLPPAAKWAFWLAIGIGSLSLLMLIFSPVMGLFYSGCVFAFARGIRKRQAWAAIAAAGFWLVPPTITLLRSERPLLSLAVLFAVDAGIALVMLMAAAALWREPASRAPAWSWAAFVVVFASAYLSFEGYVQPSASMQPTVLIGDHFFVDRITWALGRTPKRGDIVAFHYPLDRAQTYDKRIAGIPGDRVSLRNRVLYINGSAVAEPYAIHSQSTVDEYRDNFPKGSGDSPARPRAADMLSTHVHDGELVVPPGSYFMLGDNRDDSDDSRYWGLISRADIVGSPTLIYGSYDLVSRDAMPPTVFRMRWARMFKRI